MVNRFSIENFALSFFGVKALPFPFVKDKASLSKVNNYDFELSERQETTTPKGSQIFAKNALGYWYFMPVFVRYDAKTLELENAVLNITSKKTIIETPLVGVRGTVKELVSLDDYSISIKGFILSENENYPEEKVEELKNIYEKNQSVEIISALTDICLAENKKIVFKSFSLPFTAGVENLQAYTLEAVSDEPFELIIT